ncbi:MAG: Wzz/FepE/Etk N-terminal domain-containing protein [Anaerolineaceae bacterium]
MDSRDGFVLMDFLKKFVAGWKRVAICMVIGGLCGMGASKLLTPIYETRAVVAVTIDYSRTGALSDIQEDQAMRGLGSVIDSTQVREQVLLDAQAEGISVDQTSLAENFTLEREDFRWFLRVRDTDSIRAATLANLWAEDAVKVLDSAMEHAIVADHYQQYLDTLDYCLQRQAPEGMSSEPCAALDFEFLSTEIEKTASAIRDEQTMSFGLMPALQFFLAEEAPLNTAAVLGTCSILIFSGAVIGFLVAALIPNKEKE